MSTTLTIAMSSALRRSHHLELTQDEKYLFTKQLADILAYAEQVHAVDTTGVAATAQMHDARRRNERRAEAVVGGERCGCECSRSAPAAGLFRVPRVIG